MKSLQTIILIAVAAMAGCAEKSTDRIRAAGVVDGDVITLKAAAAGKLDRAVLDEGRDIKRDEVLIVINSDKLVNQQEGLVIKEKEIAANRKILDSRIAMLKTTRDYWSEQVARFERLRQSEAVSGDEAERARLKLQEVENSITEAQQARRLLTVQTESLRNQQERLVLQRADHTVTAPVSGTVLDRFVTTGEHVFPGTPLADLLDLESLYVEVFLEGSEISRITLGQDVRLIADGIEDRDFTGTVAAIGRKAEFSPKYIVSEKERRSLLYRVRVDIPREGAVFKLGMPVTVVLNE